MKLLKTATKYVNGKETVITKGRTNDEALCYLIEVDDPFQHTPNLPPALTGRLLSKPEPVGYEMTEEEAAHDLKYCRQHDPNEE